MEESWKDIEGFEGLYRVSNKGDVKSLVNNKGVEREKILKPFINSKGYLQVDLCKNKKRYIKKVHRLVAQAFLPNPQNYPCINHKDECKTNNVVTNLEWCTQKYNTNYGSCIKRMSESQINDPNKSKKVYQYSKEVELITVWESTMECQRNGFDRSAVSACCNNCYIRPSNNVYKGYIWSYTPLI